MGNRPLSLALIAAALMAAATAAQAQTLPRQFHGDWAAEPDQCKSDGESRPWTVDSSGIVGYEQGWTIRRWSQRKGIWTGRGTADDDQGSMPAKVTLRMAANGKLIFNDSEYMRCPARSPVTR